MFAEVRDGHALIVPVILLMQSCQSVLQGEYKSQPLHPNETEIRFSKSVLLWPLAACHSVLPLSFRSFFSFFRRLISEVVWPIVTKLCHMLDGDPRFVKFGQKFGCPLFPKFGGPKTSKFRRFCDLIASISGTQQDIVNRKTALKTTDTPAKRLTYFDVPWSTNGEK